MSGREGYLVVGAGSIGRRHLANLRRLFPEARLACLPASGREPAGAGLGVDATVCGSWQEALALAPRFAVVASPAPLHLSHGARLLAAGIPVLIEKPLSDSIGRTGADLAILLENQHRVAVGYNLRYLPSARAFEAALHAGRIGRVLGVSVEVGQYLPDWRPGSDYRLGVSARPELGGGALLELSHELDYLLWLFGHFDSAYCIMGNSGTLGIPVDDCVDALLRQEGGLVARVHLDFLQRRAFRRCRAIGDAGTLEWDLLANRLVLLGPANHEEVLCDEPDWDRNLMYVAELEHFSRVVEKNEAPQVSLGQGLAVLSLVDALRASAASGAPVDIKDFRT